MSRNFRFSCLSIAVLILMCIINLTVPNGIVVAADEGVNNGSALQAKLAFPLRDDKDYDDEYDDYGSTARGDGTYHARSPNDDDEEDDDYYGEELNNDDNEDNNDEVELHGNAGANGDGGFDQRAIRKQATAKPYSATSTTFCPEKCSCLGDFIECKNLNLQLPQIPNSVQDL